MKVTQRYKASSVGSYGEDTGVNADLIIREKSSRIFMYITNKIVIMVYFSF